MSSRRVVTRGLAFVVCAFLAWPNHSHGRPHTGSPSRGSSHLYVLLGLGNNSPGLSEFGIRMAQHGIPTTVGNYGDWPALAQEAIQQYKVTHVLWGSFEPPPNVFEPPRGPANVTYLPLNPNPLAFQADSGAKAGVHELKAAMMMAGLSDGR